MFINLRGVPRNLRELKKPCPPLPPAHFLAKTRMKIFINIPTTQNGIVACGPDSGLREIFTAAVVARDGRAVGLAASHAETSRWRRGGSEPQNSHETATTMNAWLHRLAARSFPRTRSRGRCCNYPRCAAIDRLATVMLRASAHDEWPAPTLRDFVHQCFP